MCSLGQLWRTEQREAREEPTLRIQTRDAGGQDQGGSPRDGEKWPNSGYFANIGYEEKREVKGSSKVWDLFLSF